MHADAQRRYRKWWLGKFCRRAGSLADFKLVVDVKTYGPPSFVYGTAELIYEDGSRVTIAGRGFRPRKCDVDVKPES